MLGFPASANRQRRDERKRGQPKGASAKWLISHRQMMRSNPYVDNVRNWAKAERPLSGAESRLPDVRSGWKRTLQRSVGTSIVAAFACRLGFDRWRARK
jgi:hypothetical protein